MSKITEYLKYYDGPEITLMEVCGTHTAEIGKCGIRSMLSSRIRLISGPGCPVCVTVTGYIDRLIELSKEADTEVVTFGDLMRVVGSRQSLQEAKAEGGSVRMVYSPLDVLPLAKADPTRKFVFAAVGFETTVPVYGMLLKRAGEEGIHNLRLLTSLKTMPPVIDWVCENQRGIDGFLAPGHVSVVTGSRIFEPLAKKYGIPFVVSGFEGEQILASIYLLVKKRNRGEVFNLYPSAVTAEGNKIAENVIDTYFEPCKAAWRGIGTIAESGLALKSEYQAFDAGSRDLYEDRKANQNCCCAEVLTGRITPEQCPLFGTACTPKLPQGACMVSSEGSCFHHFIESR